MNNTMFEGDGLSYGPDRQPDTRRGDGIRKFGRSVLDLTMAVVRHIPGAAPYTPDLLFTEAARQQSDPTIYQ